MLKGDRSLVAMITHTAVLQRDAEKLPLPLSFPVVRGICPNDQLSDKRADPQTSKSLKPSHSPFVSATLNTFISLLLKPSSNLPSMATCNLDPKFSINWWLRIPEIESLTNAYRKRDGSGIFDWCRKVAAEGRPFANTFTLLELGDGLCDDLIEEGLPLTSSELSRCVSIERDTTLTLRIILMEHNPNIQLEPSAAPYAIKWLAEQMGVSPCFFDATLSTTDAAILELPPSKFDRQVSPEPPYSRCLNGMYITQVTGSNTKVWFSHCLERNFSTYVIDDVGAKTKANIFEAIEQPLSSFLSLDSYICNEDHLFNVVYSRAFTQALEALDSLGDPDPGDGSTPRRASRKTSDPRFDQMSNSYKKVYNISRAYDNKKRVVALFKQMVKTRLQLASELYDPFTPNEAVREWSSIPRTTEILLNNMESTMLSRQAVVRDSLSMLGTLMNHKMAAFSSQLATDTRRDSSSMTTIALVTMVFLPGSFVASFFSTEFVRLVDGDERKPSQTLPLEFTPLAWIWCTITTGLTIAVIFLWSYHHGSIRRQFRGLRKLRRFVKFSRVETIIPQPRSDVNDALSSFPPALSAVPSGFVVESKTQDGRDGKFHTVIEVRES